jgi:hypothetical protein
MQIELLHPCLLTTSASVRRLAISCVHPRTSVARTRLSGVPEFTDTEEVTGSDPVSAREHSPWLDAVSDGLCAPPRRSFASQLLLRPRPARPPPNNASMAGRSTAQHRPELVAAIPAEGYAAIPYDRFRHSATP